MAIQNPGRYWVVGTYAMKKFFYLISIICNLVLANVVTAQTAKYPYYPVIEIDRDKGIFGIVGEIDFRTPLSFERILENIPNPKVLVLDSPGGSVHSALAVASRVRGMGLKTVIREDDGCYSACSMIFFAGATRVAYGELGVHQISYSSGDDDLVSGQFALADILEVLTEFDVPPQVMGIMLRTPPEKMYVFSHEENVRFGFYGSRVAAAPKQKVATPNSSSNAGSIDLLNPTTWRGKRIQGELVENGKVWFSWLHSDGRTTFQTTKGERLFGTYRITNGYVCYRYNGSTSEACRTPRRVDGRIGWFDVKGNYVSYVAGIESKSLASVSKNINVVASVAEHIKPNECALVVASRPTVQDARAYVVENVQDRRFVMGYMSENGWIAITIGTLKPHEVDPTLKRWKASGKIPMDSYCSTGTKYVAVVNIN